MRKIFLVLIIGILALAGCGGTRNTGFLKLSGISFNADVRYNGTDYEVFCEIDADKNMTAKILKPENHEGLTFEFRGGEYSLKLGDLRIDEGDTFHPDAFFIKYLYGIIDNYDSAEFIKSKKNSKLSGSACGKTFKISISPGGLPVSLTIPDIGLTADFNNMTVTE